MMVGTYRQHLACVAAQLNGVKRHRSMKPSSRDPQLELATPLIYSANKSGKSKIKSPSKKEAGAGCKSPALASREGTGETFFLDILFHRMSEMAMLQQWGVYAFVVTCKRQSERRIQMNAASTIRDHPATLKNLAEGGSRAAYFAPATTRPSPNIR